MGSWVRSLRVIRIWIFDRKSNGSWRIKETDESTLVKDSCSLVVLTLRDPCDLGSQIQIIALGKWDISHWD